MAQKHSPPPERGQQIVMHPKNPPRSLQFRSLTPRELPKLHAYPCPDCFFWHPITNNKTANVSPKNHGISRHWIKLVFFGDPKEPKAKNGDFRGPSFWEGLIRWFLRSDILFFRTNMFPKFSRKNHQFRHTFPHGHPRRTPSRAFHPPQAGRPKTKNLTNQKMPNCHTLQGRITYPTLGRWELSS